MELDTWLAWHCSFFNLKKQRCQKEGKIEKKNMYSI